MRKYFALALVLVLCVISLTGCHGSRDQAVFKVPDTLDESRTFEITFWAKNDTNKAQTRIYENAIAAFEKLYPNIKVNMRLYTDYSRIYNDVITNIATGTTPNVCITYPDHIATYLTGNNVVVPLDSLFSDERFGLGGTEVCFDAPKEDEIVSAFLDECIIDGVHYAIPYMRSTEACYVNKTYVEKLGYELPDVLTWDFIWEVSEAAMEKDENGNFKVNGQNVLIPFIYKSTDNMMIQMLRQLGAEYSDESGKIGIFNDVTKQVLQSIAPHAKSGAFSTFQISSYPANFLNAGQCIFAVDSTAGSTWMGSDAPLIDIAPDKLVQFETAVRPVPQYDTENLQMISQGPSVCVFNKEDPQEVLAAWLFAQYLLTDEVQISYSETEGYVPVTNKARETEEYKAYRAAAGTDNNTHYSVKLAATELLLTHTDDTFVTPVFNGSASLRSAAGSMVEETAKAVRRKKEVNDEFIEKLYNDTVSLYRLNTEGTGSDGRKDLGPMPTMSVVLLSVLGAVWVLLAIWWMYGFLTKNKQ